MQHPQSFDRQNAALNHRLKISVVSSVIC